MAKQSHEHACHIPTTPLMIFRSEGKLEIHIEQRVKETSVKVAASTVAIERDDFIHKVVGPLPSEGTFSPAGRGNYALYNKLIEGRKLIRDVGNWIWCRIRRRQWLRGLS